MMSDLFYNYPDVLTNIDKEAFLQHSKKYTCSVLQNLHAQFPHATLNSQLGMLDSRNIGKATPAHKIELGGDFDIDGSKLWDEFRSYQELVATTEDKTLAHAFIEIWHSSNREAMLVCHPLLANLLARVAVLPASSAEVESVFYT